MNILEPFDPAELSDSRLADMVEAAASSGTPVEVYLAHLPDQNSALVLWLPDTTTLYVLHYDVLWYVEVSPEPGAALQQWWEGRGQLAPLPEEEGGEGSRAPLLEGGLQAYYRRLASDG